MHALPAVSKLQEVVHVLNLRRRRMPAASRRVDVRAERVLLADLKAEAQVLIRWLERPPRHADCDHIHDRLHQQQQDGSQRFQLWGRWRRFQIRKTEQRALAAAAVAAVEAEAARDETFDAFVPVPKKKHCQGNGNQRPMFVEGHDFFPTCTPEFTAYKQKARRRATLRFIEKKRRQKAAAANPAGRYASRTKIANSRALVKGRFVKTVELVRAGVFAAGENRKPGT